MPTFKPEMAAHSFGELFINHLGWDRATAALKVSCRSMTFEVSAVAQKRGLVVLTCPMHRTDLANRHLLRDLQRQLKRSFHEHILISHCDAPRKQVWSWSVVVAEKRSVVHREHPFFSDSPPPRLLGRIHALAVPLAEEEHTGLLDVVEKVRQALLPDAEYNLFTKWPGYAKESDRLAMAVKSGQPGALQAMVEFHLRLAHFWAWLPRQTFGMDEADAEQTTVLGLVEAARRFDPDKGYQFSTYATYWIRQAGQRWGLRWGPFFRISDHIFWRCQKIERWANRRLSHPGIDRTSQQIRAKLAKAGVSSEHWTAYLLARQLRRRADLPYWQRASLDPLDQEPIPVEAVEHAELRARIRELLGGLKPREAHILRLRYGFDGPDHTLEEVGAMLKLTRERIRQIQEKAEERLRRKLMGDELLPDEWHSPTKLRPGDAASAVAPPEWLSIIYPALAEPAETQQYDTDSHD